MKRHKPKNDEQKKARNKRKNARQKYEKLMSKPQSQLVKLVNNKKAKKRRNHNRVIINNVS